MNRLNCNHLADDGFGTLICCNWMASWSAWYHLQPHLIKEYIMSGILTITVEGEYIIRLNQIKAEMKKLANDESPGDQEIDHLIADGLLCEALNILGFQDLAEEFEKVGKWYS